MVKIRLRRQGKKHQPIYRIVVAEARAPRDGAFIETLGYYNPLKDPEILEINEERLRHWMGHGAQPSDALEDLLRRKGLFTHETRAQRSAIARRESQAKAKAAAEAAEKAATAKAEREAKAKAKAEAAAKAAADAEAAPVAEAEPEAAPVAEIAPEAEAEPEAAAAEEEATS